jgi:hypothetical protein
MLPTHNMGRNEGEQLIEILFRLDMKHSLANKGFPFSVEGLLELGEPILLPHEPPPRTIARIAAEGASCNCFSALSFVFPRGFPSPIHRQTQSHQSHRDIPWAESFSRCRVGGQKTVSETDCLQARGSSGWALQRRNGVQGGGPVVEGTVGRQCMFQECRTTSPNPQSHEHGMPLWENSPQAVHFHSD